MEFQGRIAKLLPMRQGNSTRTGNEWYAQPFVFEYYEHESDRYADSVVLETFNTDIIPHLKEGMEVICGFGHKAKTITKQDGTQVTINDIRLYKIENVHKEQPAGHAAGMDGGQQHGAAPAPQQQGGGDDDDLPF